MWYDFTGGKFHGLKFKKGNCGVSIMRSGNVIVDCYEREGV